MSLLNQGAPELVILIVVIGVLFILQGFGEGKFGVAHNKINKKSKEVKQCPSILCSLISPMRVGKQ